MSSEALPSNLRYLRGTDSNSLLRLYDSATRVFNHSASQQEREKADKAIRRIVKELQVRKVSL